MTETENETISEEVIEQELARFAEEMALDWDISVMDEDDLDGFNKQKRKMFLAVKNGSLVINENGEAVYTPCNPKSKHKDPITFHERTGASLMTMDGKKKNYDVTKTYAVMGEMCKVHQGIFSSLRGVDIKTCEAIFALLMD